MTLKGQNQGESDFETLFVIKGLLRLNHMKLLLDINRKPYMGSPMEAPNLTLSDFERSKSRSLKFRSLIFRKGA